MLGMRCMTPEQLVENKDEVQRYYDDEGASPIVKSGTALELVLAHAPDRETIVEIGCGRGELLSALMEKRGGVEGVDLDIYIPKGSPARPRVLACDVSNDRLPYSDNEIDTAVCFETIEHLENPYHFIREVHRILRPGGVFIVSMPNVQHIFNKIFFLRKGDMPRWRKNNGHLWVAPRGVFAKAFLPYFSIRTKGYYWGFFPYRFLSRYTFFPQNELFAHTAWWVFTKK